MLAALFNRLFGERVAGWITTWLALCVLALASYWLWGIFGASIKPSEWLFWRYLPVWGCCALFALPCISVGNEIVARLTEGELDRSEHLALSLSTGVFAFFLLTAAVGFAHGYGKVSFFLIPLLLFTAGARRLVADLRRLRRKAVEEPLWLTLRPIEVVAFGIGSCALVVLFLGVLVPDDVSYDARWYHLPLAEGYAAAGRITRSPEGNLGMTVPQLASIIYTWAFCMPWVQLFEHVELALHLELVILLFSLPGIVAAVRYLVPGTRARTAWLALFVFPSVFLYDSSLHGGADHVAALWSVPAYLTLVRAFERLAPRACLLFAICISGLLMSKYTAVSAVVAPCLVLGLRAFYLTVRQLISTRSAPALRGLAVTLAGGLVFTSPHWLKNLVWQGDPFYPILRHYFHARPWNIDGEYLFAVYQEAQFAPSGTMSQKWLGMLEALYNHSYALYNWSDFHGSFPIFGSLFSASLVLMPLLRGTRRLWGLVAMTCVGIMVWYWVSDAERYLQTLLPWMAASVAALAILAWRSGLPARVGVIALGALQIVWGADMIFWPLHRMTGKSPVGVANDFFARAYSGDRKGRTKPFQEFAAFEPYLPKSARVLVHHDHVHLGLGRPAVQDATRIVYGLNYGELASPREVDRLLKSWGVTHATWDPKVVYGDETVAGDLVFHTYADSWKVLERYGGRSVAALPAGPPPERNQLVIMHQCDGSYAEGIYLMPQLRLSPYPLKGKTLSTPPPRYPMAALKDLPEVPSYAFSNERCPNPPDLKHYKIVATLNNAHYLALR